MNSAYQWIIELSSWVLMPLMYATFAWGIFMKLLIWFMVRREEWFATEFEKRVHRDLEGQAQGKEQSFYVLAKRVLERTYYELFEVRAIMKRRRPDTILGFSDRVFMVQSGCAQLVKDTLKNVRHLKFDRGEGALQAVAQGAFERNRWFNRILGVFEASKFNDFIGILPGLFIIGGIFGTFLGISQGLGSLGSLEISDIEGSKRIMDEFLVKMSFAMIKSIVGILLSVIMTLVISTLSVEKHYAVTVECFHNGLLMLWNAASSTQVPVDVPTFDEHRDPLEALAEQTLERDLKDSKPLERQAS